MAKSTIATFLHAWTDDLADEDTTSSEERERDDRIRRLERELEKLRNQRAATSS
jgi:Ni,Fe-hydrogenase III large subunit